ncbi:MAG: hypothetical protein EOP48_04855 [Sphingobacteriales bacterium]|nr:MAG: hypothetical protein EOP48_04855 [Sphingobacteriales bacterium]
MKRPTPQSLNENFDNIESETNIDSPKKEHTDHVVPEEEKEDSEDESATDENSKVHGDFAEPDKALPGMGNDLKPVAFGSSMQTNGLGNKTRPIDQDKLEQESKNRK